jgi:ubiquitin conjugation factor E4 B
MTFLSSPWYIKNPFLKAKLVTVLFFGTLGTEGDKHGVLFGQLNSHKLCLKHLMAALVSFYIGAGKRIKAERTD